jgi:hypothetical protein
MYCSVEDVLSIAYEFRKDVPAPNETEGDANAEYRLNTNLISRAKVEDMITEAGIETQLILRPRYDIAVIDAYVTTPPYVKYLCATLAAIQLLEQRTPAAIDLAKERIAMLTARKTRYVEVIANGTLQDSTGELIPRKVMPGVRLGADDTTFPAYGELADLYENGRTY